MVSRMQITFTKQNKYAKTVCAICMALLMIFSSVCLAFAQDTPCVNVDAKYDFKTNKVVVTLELQNNPGIISFMGKLSYDKNAFRLVDIQDAGLLSGSQQDTSAEALKSDPYVLMWYDLNAVKDTSAVNDTDCGKLVTLTFDIVDGKSGDFAFTFTHDKDNTRNLAGEKVEFSVVQNSTVSVPAYIYAAEYKANGRMQSFELYDRTKTYASGTVLFGVSSEYNPVMVETLQ